MTTWTHQDIQDDIEEGKFRLAQQKEEAEAAAQARRDQEDASNAAAWAPIIARIKESIPPWSHQFLVWPLSSPDYREDHQWHRCAATIAIPDTATIFAYGETSDLVRFRPARYAVSDDDELWDVITLGGQPVSHWERDGLTADFLIALATAVAEHDKLPELHATAERRNAQRQKVKVETPPARVGHDWVGLALLSVGEAREDGSQAAIAYALIGILVQLQSVTTPLRDCEERLYALERLAQGIIAGDVHDGTPNPNP